MLTLQDVTKSFGSKQVLEPTNLSIDAGNTYVLIGPSGCGKSTLLRLMIGLVEPTNGTVEFQGETLRPERYETVRQRMGFVVQDGGLFPHLNGYDNVALMARYVGWTQQQIQARVEELASLTHLESDVLQRFPIQISGGQRQRVSLMRALMLDPDILLLDEPLGALDPMIRSELQTELREIFQSLKKTVVLVTHDMGEASYFGDVIVLIREGRIVQQGQVGDLIAKPAEPYVTKFIQAQRSLIDGEKS